jgi:hypothetical protein
VRSIPSRASGLALCLLFWLCGTALAVDPLDVPFAHHQFLVHATGHGTTSGGVADDFYTLLNEAPDATGHYTIPDGSGGTIGYASDYHAGPFNTPREVCQAAAAKGIAPQTWTVAYDYNTTFDCAALSPATPAAEATPGAANGPILTCDPETVAAGGSASCTASMPAGGGSATQFVWYVDGTQLTGSGPSQQVSGLADGNHQVEVIAVVDGESLGPAQVTIVAGDVGATSGQGGGIPVAVLVALAAVAAVIVAAALAWQRAHDAGQNQVKNACHELAARYRLMVQARTRRAAAFAQGGAALSHAYTAEVNANAARSVLESQRNQAAALLGSAAGLAAGALAASAASVAGSAAAIRSAMAWVSGGSEALLDYLPMVQGGAGPILGLGQSIMNLAANLEADAQALTGLAAVPGVASIATVTDTLAHGLDSVDRAMAAAQAMRQQLESTCQTALREVGELDSEIGTALAQLASCPGGLQGMPPDPRGPLPSLPLPPGNPPRG